MALLIDTGILLRAFDMTAPHYRDIRRALRKLVEQGERLVVSVQNVVEFWNVCTRPLDRNGQGHTPARAARRARLIEQFCEVVSEDLRSFEIWKQLSEKYDVSGVAVHDARLVAVMLTQGIDQILTLNDSDFRRYKAEGISIVTLESWAPKSN